MRGDVRWSTSWNFDSGSREWRKHSACRDADTDVFFPDSEVEEDAAPAKAICAGCPVTDECLAFALSTRQEDGVWGGMTEAERRRLKRKRREMARASA